MFSAVIDNTVPLMSEEDRTFFNNVEVIVKGGTFYGRDCSAIATIRAILGNRVTERFSLIMTTSEYTVPKTTKCLILYKCDDGYFDDDKGEFSEQGYVELSDLSGYLTHQTGVRTEVLTKESNQSTVVIIGNAKDADTARKNFHLIQAFIPRYCPWFFVDKPLTDLETRFLKSLTEKTAGEYLKLLREIAEGFNDRKRAILESQIGSLGKVLNEKRINGIKRTIESTQDKIEDCQRQYSSLIRDLQEQRIFLMGLESQADTSDEMCKELLDYLQHNKHIRIEKVSPDTGWIRFVALGTLSIYDPDVLESMKRNGSLYRFKDRTAYVERITNACFGDDAPFAIKVCARYEISLDGEVNVYSGGNYAAYPDYIPNPHIQRHACLGTYQNPIQSALLAGDPIQAIEQCLGSAQSVNLGESEITFYPFMREVFDSKNKIIQMPDGSSATLDEADEWLKKQEESNV